MTIDNVVSRKPSAAKTAIIHLMVPVKHGPFSTSRHEGNPETGTVDEVERRWLVACKPDSMGERFMTLETGSVTCPLCRASAFFAAVQAATGENADAAALAAMSGAAVEPPSGNAALPEIETVPPAVILTNPTTHGD